MIKKINTNKKDYLKLLLLADPDESMIDQYVVKGELFVLFDDHIPVCTAVVVKLSDSECELKNIATDEKSKHRGFATKMLNHLFHLYQKKFSAMFVGTSESMVGFYNKFGFVYSHTVKNFFIDNYPEPIFEDGIQCIDMIYLKKDL